MVCACGQHRAGHGSPIAQNEVMNNSRLKSAVLVTVLALVVVGVSLYALGREPSPSPTPLFVSVTAPPVSISPVTTLAGTTTRPKITWSSRSINVILSPGESTSSDLTFTSSFALQNVVVEAVHEVAGFLSIQPNSFASVPAGQPQPVHVSFAIPSGTPLGTYSGTVHVRLSSQTLPETIKIVINVWNNFLGSDYSMKFPPNWTFKSIDNAHTGFFPNTKKPDLSQEYVGDIIIEVIQNTSQVDLQTFYQEIASVNLFSNSQSNRSLIINGLSAAKFLGVFGMIQTDIIAIDKGQ